MNRKPVESSNIVSIGHDGKNTLEVEFKRGGIYQYSPVSSEGFIQMQQAESVGKYFHQNIKSNEAITHTKMEKA